MTKLPRWPGKDIITVFIYAGWRLDHIEGSHHILVKEGIETILVVPVHGTKPIKVGLLTLSANIILTALGLRPQTPTVAPPLAGFNIKSPVAYFYDSPYLHDMKR